VSLGRRLREDKKLKVRQPLATFTVVSRDPAVRDAALAGASLIGEQLNVKSVATSADEAAFCSIGVKPNFAVLKERAASKLKDIGKSLATFGFPEVSRLESGETIEVAGERIALEDVLLARTPAKGMAVATEGDVTVVLDTALTDELADEGLARELNSVLQQARKGMGLDVSDRVRIRWDSADPNVARALERHGKWLAGEVLAVEFSRDAAAATEANLNGKSVRYELTKS
jgi:isoleucyl-tRNA synthetase